MQVPLPPNTLRHRQFWSRIFKVEEILKGSLDLIQPPSLSLKIQIMGGKDCLRSKGKTLLGIVNKLLYQKFVEYTQQCFAFKPQANFPAHNLNFQ